MKAYDDLTADQKIKRNHICAIVCAVVVILTVGYIIYQKYCIKDMIDTCTSTTTGQVTTVQRRRYGLYLTAEYTIDSKTYTTNTNYGSTYDCGDSIAIHYSPADPSKSYAGDKPLSVFFLWYCIAGVFFLAVILFIKQALDVKRKDVDYVVP